jgi:hypothetical protein
MELRAVSGFGALVCVIGLIISTCLAAEASGAAGLQLKPVELELIGGRKVVGRLAAETETHLVLYSLGGGALHSFPKRLLSKAAVADTSQRVDWSGWPDAAPATGPKPDYTTQKWGPPKRLRVWAKPGKPGRLNDPANWLVFGEPLVPGKVWDDETDAVLPGSEKPYLATGGVSEPVGDRLNLTFRHMTVENGADVQTQDARVNGNLWIREQGSFGMRFSIAAVGPHHTFIRNDRPKLFKVGVNPHALPGKTLGGYYIAQYITVQKAKGASLEFVGQFLSNDKFNVYSGTCVIGPGGAVMTSNRNPDHIHPGATIEVMSGGIWGKHTQRNRSVSYVVEGTATIGSVRRPITEDTVVAMPFKDYSGVMGGARDVTVARDWAGGEVFGFQVTPKGRLRVHSADSAKARAVFCYHKRETGAECLDFNLPPGQLNTREDLYKKLPRRIDLVLLGDVELDGVVFEDVHKGGIRLRDMAMRDKFRNVVWGKNCGGKPDEMFSLFKPHTPPQGWVEEVRALLQGN